jgi:Predicted metal-binding integral membrane protein (DUF2182)
MSTYQGPHRSALRVTPVTVAFLLLGAALVTWIVTVDRMRGMDAGPVTDLGGLAWFTGIWVTMMAAMMLPSAAPMVLLFHRISSERAKRGQTSLPAWVFCLSYLAVWTLYGLAAYGLYRLIVHFDFGFLEWDRGGRFIAGAAICHGGAVRADAAQVRLPPPLPDADALRHGPLAGGTALHLAASRSHASQLGCSAAGPQRMMGTTPGSETQPGTQTRMQPKQPGG